MSTQQTPVIDTHAHVFHRGLSFVPSRRFTPDYDAPLDAYLGQLDAHGVARGVLVAVSILGNDNSYLLDCLRSQPERLRGVVAINPETDLGYFDEFESAGVVGVRVNLTGNLPVPDLAAGAWAEAVAECVKRGWHIEINDRAARLHESVSPLVNAGVNVVVDHFGMPDRNHGIADAGFSNLLGYAGSRKVWVKLSGAYRTSFDIARAAAPKLLDAFGAGRLLWASDWPFTQYESTQTYGAQRAAINEWLPDAQQRQTVLSDTPRSLFKF
ncbi:amidohydrolase family protein [Paraburkholderia sp. Tr-20389]|uniref:amidohydrolase family protein n=1 Tax=Paraburkholderia sp. Tr-20389 TaxID=2703903 RepID=UPI00197D223F|nr:amidohydrolase family protein [Paraburkholderia sp. Tr-20389]MBN3754796.1 amidohydrolase family protein [Paraburkholderia sp. Tr-20389]